MKKDTPPPLVPTKPFSENERIPICGKRITDFWMEIDWMTMINLHKPHLRLNFESHDDWLLFDQIDILAENMDVDFADAAHWVLRRVWGENFEAARAMQAMCRPWDDDMLYTCRVVALQFSKHLYPNDNTLYHLDHLVHSLLRTDDEVLHEANGHKSLPC